MLLLSLGSLLTMKFALPQPVQDHCSVESAATLIVPMFSLPVPENVCGGMAV
jgi:hypothetical protein